MLVGDWGDNNGRETYALFPDGKEIVRTSNPFFWTFASQLRLHLKSPFYQKDSIGTICRIVYTRHSWLEPFVRLCNSVTSNVASDELQEAFTDGHKKFVQAAQQANATYEKYRSFGLEE